MASAIDVARYFLWLAEQESEPEIMTNLRIQKLLYYVQGWALAARGRPLFTERIEAWKKGPVVRSVWQLYTCHGRSPIPSEEAFIGTRLSPADKMFIRSVWEGYKKNSAIALIEMSHSEKPWIEARAGIPDSDPSDAEISNETMESWFQQRFEESSQDKRPLRLANFGNDPEQEKYISLADLESQLLRA